MSSVLTELHPPLLADLVPADIPNSYARRDLGAVPDARLCELVAEVIARPKVAQADSFVLHAPLELLARTALLPLVEPPARELARQRIVWLGATYAAAGEEVGRTCGRSYNDPETAVDHLASALWAGDLDEADDAASWVAATVSPVDLSRALAEAVLPRLSAAGHGSIFLYLLPRIAPRSATAAGMVRGLVRRTGQATRLERDVAPAPTALGQELRRFGRTSPSATVAWRPREQLHLPDDVARRPQRPSRRGARPSDAVARHQAGDAGPAAHCGVVDGAGRSGPCSLRLEPLPHHAAGRAGRPRRRGDPGERCRS